MSNRPFDIPGNDGKPLQSLIFVPAKRYITLVDSVLQDWAAKGVRFSATDVTHRLREENPTLDIAEPMVQIAVNTQAPAHGLVVIGTEQYGGKTAQIWKKGGETDAN